MARWKTPRFGTGRNDFGNTETVLIPGPGWHPLDGGGLTYEFVPDQWNGPYVGVCLEDAYRTISMLPDAGAGSSTGFWPQIVQELTEEERKELDKQAVLRRDPPTAQAISRMEAALWWPGTYLLADGDIDLARIVTRVAFYRAIGHDRDYAAMRLLPKDNRNPTEIEQHLDRVRERYQFGVDQIAGGLIRHRVPLFKEIPRVS